MSGSWKDKVQSTIAGDTPSSQPVGLVEEVDFYHLGNLLFPHDIREDTVTDICTTLINFNPHLEEGTTAFNNFEQATSSKIMAAIVQAERKEQMQFAAISKSDLSRVYAFVFLQGMVKETGNIEGIYFSTTADKLPRIKSELDHKNAIVPEDYGHVFFADDEIDWAYRFAFNGLYAFAEKQINIVRLPELTEAA